MPVLLLAPKSTSKSDNAPRKFGPNWAAAHSRRLLRLRPPLNLRQVRLSRHPPLSSLPPLAPFFLTPTCGIRVSRPCHERPRVLHQPCRHSDAACALQRDCFTAGLLYSGTGFTACPRAAPSRTQKRAKLKNYLTFPAVAQSPPLPPGLPDRLRASTYWNLRFHPSHSTACPASYRARNVPRAAHLVA